MLMEHLLCDDVGGNRNVCGMEIYLIYSQNHILH